MTKERATVLAASIDVGRDSPGVCPAYLLFVASEIETGNERRVAGRITSFAPLLWAEGLGAGVLRAAGCARARQRRRGSRTRRPEPSRHAQHDLPRGRAAACGRDQRGGEASAYRIDELTTIE